MTNALPGVPLFGDLFDGFFFFAAMNPQAGLVKVAEKVLEIERFAAHARQWNCRCKGACFPYNRPSGVWVCEGSLHFDNH
ncbi:MAG: hypothetical protein P8K78_09705 [Pirellulales bacterium]|nr:hypothetical protein [Pirellulales bacterium]